MAKAVYCCLFNPQGIECVWTIEETESACKLRAVESLGYEWEKLEKHGYTVRPVTITEIPGRKRK